MYIYTPFCRNRITLYRYVTVFIMPHMGIELEDNKQFILNIPPIAEFANSVDLDEVANNEPPHLDLHCLPSSL